MQKRIALALLGAASAVVLSCTACTATVSAKPTSSATGSSGPVTISLESYLPAFGAGGTATLNDLIAGFEKANRDITVNVIPDSSTATASLSSTYQREAATNSLPDVGQVTFDSMRFTTQNLGAQPLDTLYGKAALQTEFGGKYPYSPAVTKLAVVGTHTYGVPWTLSTPVLFYNPTLFQKAGLNPSTPPTTWAEVAKDSAAIKSATGATGLANGCVGQGASGSDWCLQAIFASNGGSVINSSGTKTTFASAANTRALQQLQKLAADGSMTDLTLQQTIQQFADGQVAMALDTSALQTSILTAVGSNFTVKDGSMPAFSGHQVKPTNSGSALMVFSKDPAKQQAAWKLIQYLTNADSETAITKGIGYPPLRPSLVDDESYLKPYATQQPLIAANLKQLSKITPWESYPGNNFLQIETTLADAVSKSIFQSADPSQALKSAQSQAEGLVG